MADITEIPDTRRLQLLWAHLGGPATDISVTLIGQSLSLARGSIAGYEWGENPVGRSLTLAQGTPSVSIVQNVSINLTGQVLSLNRGTPIIFDFIPSSQSLALAQGTPSVISDLGNIPVGRQLLLNQSPTIADDLSYTTVGQSAAFALGTPTVSLAAETIVSLVGQQLTLGRGDPSIASTVIVINPPSRLLVLTQSPNIVEERLLNLIGQDLYLAQGTPTVNIAIDPGTTVSIVGQSLILSRGVAVGAVANFIPVGRQLTLSFPSAVVRVDRIEEIDGKQLTLNQGTPTVVSIPGVTNVAGILLVLSRGIPLVVTTLDTSITGQALSLAQGAVTVAISADNAVSILGQQLTLAQGTVSTTVDISVIIPGLDLFLYPGIVDVQDNVTVSVPIAGQQLTLSQGTIEVIVNEELFDVEISGLDLVLAQGSVHITSTSVNEEIAQEGIELILNQGAVCVNIFDMDVDEGDPVYVLEGADAVDYIDDGIFVPTYTPEHCD